MSEQSWEELSHEFRLAARALRRVLGKVTRKTNIKQLEEGIKDLNALLPGISNGISMECLWTVDNGDWSKPPKKERDPSLPSIDPISKEAIPEDWTSRLIPLWTSDPEFGETGMDVVERLSKRRYPDHSHIAEFSNDEGRVLLFDGGWWVGVFGGEEECGVVIKFGEGVLERVLERAASEGA